MKKVHVVSALLAASAASTTLSTTGVAAAEGAAMEANEGFRLGLGPEILFPTDNGPLGGGLVLDGRYGIPVGPVVIAPGGRLEGYLISERFVGTAMPTLRVVLPVGPLAPYAIGGVGIGGLSHPGDSGLAYTVGGGLMIHFGRIFAIGAELTYERISGTEFQVIGVGPSIQFGG